MNNETSIAGKVNLKVRENAAFRAGFTLIELLVVIAIIGVLAGLLVGLAGIVGTKSKMAKVQADLSSLELAIDHYKSTFNFYPPDNFDPVTKTVDPVRNLLFYELIGTVADQAGTTFTPPIGQPITSGNLQTVFHRDGIANAVDTPAKPRAPFLNVKLGQYADLTVPGSPVVLVVPVPFKLGSAGQPIAGSTINPWRYVSTSPTNNQTSYDLWAEFPIGNKLNVKGNFKN